MSQNNEHREFSRINIPVSLQLSCDSHAPITATSFDVSMNGASFGCTEMISPGTHGRILISLGQGDAVAQIDAGCKIIRSDGDLMAVNFTEIDIDGYEHLKRLVTFNADDSDQIERELESHIGLCRK